MSISLIMRVLLIFGLIAALASGSEQNDLSKLEDEARAYCNNEPFELTKISQVKGIAEILTKDTNYAQECLEGRYEAMIELAEVVTKDMDDVCTLAKADLVRNFYLKYISTATEQSPSNPFPEQLRTFLLAFGLKMSLQCKKNMIYSLVYDTQQQLKENDFRLMQSLSDKKGPMNEFLKAKDYDDLVFASEMNAILSDEQELAKMTPTKDDDKIYIQIGASGMVRRTQTVCHKRLKPFYDRLIMPIVRLANIGFNYRGEEIEREVTEIAVNSDVQRWYRIVFICEAMAGVEVVELKGLVNKPESINKNTARVLSKEELEALKEKEGDNVVIGGEDPTVEPVEYKPADRIRIEDEVYDKTDEHMVDLVNNFVTDRSEEEPVKKRVEHKVRDFITRMLTSGKFEIIGSLFQKKGNGDSPSITHSINNDLVKGLNELSQQKELSGDSEAALIGLSNRVKRDTIRYGYGHTSRITTKPKTTKKQKIFRWVMGWVLTILLVWIVVTFIPMG